jgi:hypothetical protein
MQILVHKKKSLRPPKKHAMRYKLKEKSKCDIRAQRREALKGPT